MCRFLRREIRIGQKTIEVSRSCVQHIHKVYADIIRKRLEDEVERKGILPESQGGFRRGRGTIDNIFVLDHLVQREKKEKDKKIFAAFIDLKAAFDNVDRKKLWRVIEEKEISKGLIGRLKKLYEGTNMRIRTNKGRTGKLETAKGVRQGCVLSPLLFNLYVRMYMEKRGIGGIKLGIEYGHLHMRI